MKRTITTFLATGTYAGYSPVMPGTLGTFWGVLLAWLVSGLPVYLEVIAIVAVFAASVVISSEALKVFGGSDPSEIVVDEICGTLVALFLIPINFFNVILVFLLFRFFDILKPYPVSAIDRGVAGGFGVVLDDVAAGVYANVFARFIIWTIG